MIRGEAAQSNKTPAMLGNMRIFRLCKTHGVIELERVKGIEPSYEAWEAAVLPLNYTRVL